MSDVQRRDYEDFIRKWYSGIKNKSTTRFYPSGVYFFSNRYTSE